jgi:Protein of unknown function (DUF998)
MTQLARSGLPRNESGTGRAGPGVASSAAAPPWAGRTKQSYSPLRQTVSVLAGQAGTDSWVMTGALFLLGGCQILTGVGLTGVWMPARILLVITGLSSIGIAASPSRLPARRSSPRAAAWAWPSA